MLRAVRRALRALVRDEAEPVESELVSLGSVDRQIVERALPYTMTGAARLRAAVEAVRYCVSRDIPGAFAECGVWRGGSVLAMILTLQAHGRSDRDIYLYDTFEGMNEPTEHDVSRTEGQALSEWRAAQRSGARPWADWFGADVFDEAGVRALVLSTGYPEARVHFVRGPVEQTLPSIAPDRLALLRLDTDWYESTRHELVHLYPRLSENGVLIIDDYGHWEGARRAVDEYFSEHGPSPLLHWIDYTARICVKH
jgi:hypothetical protein